MIACLNYGSFMFLCHILAYAVVLVRLLPFVCHIIITAYTIISSTIMHYYTIIILLLLLCTYFISSLKEMCPSPVWHSFNQLHRSGLLISPAGCKPQGVRSMAVCTSHLLTGPSDVMPCILPLAWELVPPSVCHTVAVPVENRSLNLPFMAWAAVQVKAEPHTTRC